MVQVVLIFHKIEFLGLQEKAVILSFEKRRQHPADIL